MSASSLWPIVILLASVVTPISLAEESPVYIILIVLAGAVALWAARRRKGGLVGETFAHVVAVLAFAYLMFEYVVLDRILVMALSHFLITVCAVKLLQARTLRNEAEIIILSLMLLVVGAIVSGDVLFGIALVVAVSVGVSGLIRLYLLAEMGRIALRPVAVTAGAGLPARGGHTPAWEGKSLGSVAGVVAVWGVCVGAAVFILCPRVESGFFKEFQEAHAGPVLTGFSASADLRGGQTISPSERTVMRVRVTGPESFSSEDESRHYFRGHVSDRYGRRAAGLAAGWGWQRPAPPSDAMRTLAMDDGPVVLAEPVMPDNTIEYHFWLEPGNPSHLFTPSPILTLSTHDFDEARLNLRDELVRVQRTGKLIRYSVTTVPAYAAGLVKSRLGENRAQDPPTVLPEIPLPRADEIVRFIDGQIGDVGPLDVPANRESFAERLENLLSSRPFAYTLSPPATGLGREPIGEFLLRTRSGHCEFFASAMVVVCQLKGVPARLVSGYRGGEFNPVGGFLIVREKHAHAWVEVFVPGKGWMSFDPTPGASRVAAPAGSWLNPLQSFLDYAQFHWSNLVVTYDASARRELMAGFQAWLTRPAHDEATVPGAIVAFVRELFGGRLEMSTRDRILYWVIAIQVVILVVLVGHIVISLGRRLLTAAVRWRTAARRSARGRVEVEFYQRFCRRLEVLGLRRPDHQTPAEFADALAQRHPALQGAPELIRLYYGLAFGSRGLSPDRESWVERFLGELKRLDRESLGGSKLPQS